MKRIVDVSLRSLCAVWLECRTASICRSIHDDRFHRWTSEMLTFAWQFTQAPLRSNSIQRHVERYFSMPLQKKTTLMTGTRSGPPAFIRQWGDDSCDFNDIRRRISLNCRQHQTIKDSSNEQRRRRLQHTQTQPESTSAAEQTVHSDISLTESQCSPPSPSSIGLNTNL